MTQLQLSARAYHRILKLARTIAGLAGDESIQSAHLAEALQHRSKGVMVQGVKSDVLVYGYKFRPSGLIPTT